VIDPFGFAQGRLSIACAQGSLSVARVATALPAAPKKSKRKQIKQKATKLFCLGRNGIFVFLCYLLFKIPESMQLGISQAKN
jgi:hypothetical protein